MKGSNLFIDLAGDNSITINQWTSESYRIEEFVFDDISFTAEQFLAANGLSI